MTDAAATEVPGGRVTTLELFFDLVFVFTLTQFTGLLAHDISWEAAGHVVVMLALIFWMYDGYAWLTNQIDPNGGRARILLLAGMASYFVIALAVPTAFTGSGLAFGIAWLIVTVVHSFLFVNSASDISAAAMRGLAPYNLLCGVIVVIGGALGGDAQLIIWSLTAVAQWLAGHLVETGGFDLEPSHFAERHGLLVIVAIGESVVAMGIGAEGLPVDAKLIFTAVVGLLISAGLWFAYFGRDDDAAAERAMHAADMRRRTDIALYGYGMSHFFLLLGIILAAVGVKKSLGHPGDPLEDGPALCVAAGVALYLAGDVLFRRVLGLGRSRVRLAAAALVFAAVPAATELSASTGLIVVLAVLAATFAAERQLFLRATQTL